TVRAPQISSNVFVTRLPIDHRSNRGAAIFLGYGLIVVIGAPSKGESIFCNESLRIGKMTRLQHVHAEPGSIAEIQRRSRSRRPRLATTRRMEGDKWLTSLSFLKAPCQRIVNWIVIDEH